MPYITTLNDYKKALYESNLGYNTAKEQLNKYYDSAFAGIDKSFSNQFSNLYKTEDLAKTDLAYDFSKAVNDAYAASLQMNESVQSSNLGQGYKNLLMSSNAANLESAYEQYRKDYMSNLSNLSSQFNETALKLSEEQSELKSVITEEQRKALSSIDEEVAISAEKLKEYENSYYSYLSYLFENDLDTVNKMAFTDYVTTDINGNRVLKSQTDINSQLFDLNDATGQFELSNEGRKYFDLLENYQIAGGYSFNDYLLENNPELLDWLETNNGAEIFKNITGRDKEWYKDKNVLNINTYDYRVNDFISSLKQGENIKFTNDMFIDSTYLDDDAKEALTEKNISSNTNIDYNTYKVGKVYNPDEFLAAIAVVTEGQTGVVTKKKGSIVRAVVEKAKTGSLKDGTIIDINYGKGEKFYVYYDGEFKELVSNNDKKPSNSGAVSDFHYN